MKIENEELKQKIELYHDMIRGGEDVTKIKNEIADMTKDYGDKKINELNFVKSEFHNIQNEIKTRDDKSYRKEYIRLIDLYRMSIDISKDISKYKKILREIK